MFIGEYHHNIDNKGRITLPLKFREDLESGFVITRGLDNCLFLYPKAYWDQLKAKISDLSFTKQVNRNFARFFFSGAAVGEFDKQGRVNITSVLIDYANLEKECVIVGVGKRIEIWSLDNWTNFYDSIAPEMSDIAESLYVGIDCE